MTSDAQLLSRFANDRDEAAFAELIRRRLDLVFSTALRLVAGDRHLAEDVTQTVFSDLARHPHRALRSPVLSAWLHTSTRYAAAKAVRTESRRRTREQSSTNMNPPDVHAEPDWSDLQPVVDDALGSLPAGDRDVLLLRFFEAKSHEEVGQLFGISANAARMRVERALERLRRRLAARGITSTALALGKALAQHAVAPTPADIGARLLEFMLRSGGLPAPAAGWLAQPWFTTPWAGFALVGLLGMGSLVALVVFARRPATSESRRPALQAEATSGISDSLRPTPPPWVAAAAASNSLPSSALELILVDAKTGLPIGNRPAVLRGWIAGEQTMKDRTVHLDEQGRCAVPFDPLAKYDFRVLTHVEGYADTQLRWHPKEGEAIPPSYTLRLIRPTRIAGRVVDAEGVPVESATVGINTEPMPVAPDSPEVPGIDYLTARTGPDGRWSLDRLAPAWIDRLQLSANHPRHVRSETYSTANSPGLADRLRDGSATLRLERGVTIRGQVVDPEGNPVSQARVIVGTRHSSITRESISDASGRFVLEGCEPREGIVTASAPGYAPVAAAVTAPITDDAVRLQLGRPAILRLRVLDPRDRPIAGARVLYDGFPRARGPTLPQVEWQAATDAEGRVQWNEAPSLPLPFDIGAAGFSVRRGVQFVVSTEEQVVRLQPSASVIGHVVDARTGEGLSKFRVGLGVAPATTADATPRWLDGQNAWREFFQGTFRWSLESPPILVGDSHPGWVFRVEAPGYRSVVSRTVASDERDAPLRFELEPESGNSIEVRLPDGRPAAAAEIGLLREGTDLNLARGRFVVRLGQAGAFLLMADAEGRFQLPESTESVRLFAAHPDGYGDLPVEDARRGGVITLGSTRIDGVWRSGGRPVANREVRLSPLMGERRNVWLVAEAFVTRTDDQGRFTLDRLPPGRLTVQGLGTESTPLVIRRWTAQETVQAEAGTTRSIVLGGAELRVRFRLPPELAGVPDLDINARVLSRRSPPDEIASNPEAVTRWEQSEEHAALFRRPFKGFSFVPAGDGSWVAEGASPDTYTLDIAAVAGPNSSIRAIARQVLVIGESDTDRTIDLGTIELSEPNR